MRNFPYHNVHDVKTLTEKAFSEVTTEFVENCYNHVLLQEEYYKRLLQIEPLPGEVIDSWEIEEPEYQISATDFLENQEPEIIEMEVTQSFDPEEVVDEIPGYSCAKCDFKTSNMKSLTKHAKSHRSCDKCDKTFSGTHSKRNYELHIKSHEPKSSKVFPCEHCGKRFPFESYLKRHVKNVHLQSIVDSVENNTEENVPNEIEFSDKVQHCSTKRKQKLVARKLF